MTTHSIAVILFLIPHNIRRTLISISSNTITRNTNSHHSHPRETPQRTVAAPREDRDSVLLVQLCSRHLHALPASLAQSPWTPARRVSGWPADCSSASRTSQSRTFRPSRSRRQHRAPCSRCHSHCPSSRTLSERLFACCRQRPPWPCTSSHWHSARSTRSSSWPSGAPSS